MAMDVLEGAGGFFVLAFVEQSRSEIAEVAIVVGPQRNRLFEHCLRFGVFGLTDIEDPQRAVSSPVIWTHTDSSLESFFGFIELVEILVGLGEMPISLIVDRIEFHCLAELFGGFLELPGSVFERS